MEHVPNPTILPRFKLQAHAALTSGMSADNSHSEKSRLQRLLSIREDLMHQRYTEQCRTAYLFRDLMLCITTNI